MNILCRTKAEKAGTGEGGTTTRGVAITTETVDLGNAGRISMIRPCVVDLGAHDEVIADYRDESTLL